MSEEEKLTEKLDAVSETVQQYLMVLPPPSSLFSASIRTIRKAEAQTNCHDSDALRDLTVSSTFFTVNVSPTLKTAFYKAAEEYHPEQLKAVTPLAVRGMLHLFSPAEVCGILTTTYLFRHLKRRCDESEFTRFSEKMLTHMEIGALVGKTVKHIGSGNGLLLGLLRCAAHGIFSLVNLKKYQELRRGLEKGGALFDPEREKALFGCTNRELAAGLARTFGYGLPVSLGILLDGSVDEPLPEDAVPAAIAEEVMCWRITSSLTEAFHLNGTAPAVGEESELYLPKEEAAALEAQCATLLRDGPKCSWIGAKYQQLPEEIKKQLEIVVRDKPTGGMEELDEGEEASS